MLLPQTRDFQLLQVFHKYLIALFLKYTSQAYFSFKWCIEWESGPLFQPFIAENVIKLTQIKVIWTSCL